MQETKIIEESKPLQYSFNKQIIGDNYKGVITGYYD